MKRIRWSDDDHYFGPFLYAKDKYKNLALVLGSGDDEDYPGCRLRVSAFGHTVILSLPPIIKPYKEKVVVPDWRLNGTAERLGRDYYFNSDEREYGFSYGGAGSMGGGGFLQVFFGRQSHSSSDEKRWGCFTPWNSWRFVRSSMYGLKGEHYYTEPKIDWKSLGLEESMEVRRNQIEVKESCPTRIFSFKDFDGEQLTAKTRIDEREWRLGEGSFKWLSWFAKPMIRRSLDIDFSGETGKKKGSWKGGTTGHSIEMLPGELHEGAFRRYCAQHDMTFEREV
jgi:hypothetical protein